MKRWTPKSMYLLTFREVDRQNAGIDAESRNGHGVCVKYQIQGEQQLTAVFRFERLTVYIRRSIFFAAYVQVCIATYTQQQ